MLQIPEHRRGTLGVLAEQEHQPGNAPLLGGLVLQLGVGHLRPVAHRRPVPEPGDQHVHIRRRDRLPAHLRRLLVPRGEVRHVRHRVPSPDHRVLRRRDERPPRREPPQLRRVRQEHPPRRRLTGHDPQHPSRSPAPRTRIRRRRGGVDCHSFRPKAPFAVHISEAEFSSSLGALIVRDGENIGSGTEEVVPVGSAQQDVVADARSLPAAYICRFRAVPVPGHAGRYRPPDEPSSRHRGSLGSATRAPSERCRLSSSTNPFGSVADRELAPAATQECVEEEATGCAGGSVPRRRPRAGDRSGPRAERARRGQGTRPAVRRLPRYDRESVATLLEGMLPGQPRRTAEAVDETSSSTARVKRSTRPGSACWCWLWRNGLDIIMLAATLTGGLSLDPDGLLSLLPVHAAGVSEDRHAGCSPPSGYAPERPHPRSLSSNRHRLRIGPLSLLLVAVRGRTRTPAGIAPLRRGPRDDRDQRDLGRCQAR